MKDFINLSLTDKNDIFINVADKKIKNEVNKLKNQQEYLIQAF